MRRNENFGFQAPRAPMIAPMTTRTASQWPASMTVTMGFVPRKAWFVAVVVSTKPTQTKKALMTPPRMVTSARWPISPASIQAIRRHPTAATMKGSGVGLQSSFRLPERVLPDLAEGGVPSPAHEESRDSGDNDSEIVDRNGTHFSPFLSPARRQMILHSSAETGCTESLELLTSTIPLSA